MNVVTIAITEITSAILALIPACFAASAWACAASVWACALTSARFVASAWASLSSRRLPSNQLPALSASPGRKLPTDSCRETVSSPNFSKATPKDYRIA